MRAKKKLNILLTSTGRRPYLVEWFKEALSLNGLEGSVLVADNDIYAASKSLADVVLTPPLLTDKEYVDWISQAVLEHEVGFALSFNDYELSKWSELNLDSNIFINLLNSKQTFLEDKYLMASTFKESSVSIPNTYLGTEVSKAINENTKIENFIVKARFGSGSTGLATAARSTLKETIFNVSNKVHDNKGLPVLDENLKLKHVVIQPMIEGIEFGLDVVNDFNARFASVLARKKISMRAGETDQACSVETAPFENTARMLSKLVLHRGLIDVDLMQDDAGTQWVIDINPRFGGGYPFSHVAGANIPAAYIAWFMGETPKKEWLVATPNFVSAKYVAFTEL